MDDKYLHDVPDSPMSAPKSTLAPSDNLRDETLHDEPLGDNHANKDGAQPEDDTYQQQSTAKVALLIVSCLLSMFLVALDRTIISTVSHTMLLLGEFIIGADCVLLGHSQNHK